jgi:hypothetical protein
LAIFDDDGQHMQEHEPRLDRSDDVRKLFEINGDCRRQNKPMCAWRRGGKLEEDDADFFGESLKRYKVQFAYLFRGASMERFQHANQDI